MARYDDQWCINVASLAILLLCIEVSGRRNNDPLTACQHLRRAESRRAKALLNSTIRIPRCSKLGEFEPIQCTNEILDCWCVDEYGFELANTRRTTRDDVNCAQQPSNCSATSCRMFCSSGFARDSSGCAICKCRDPCEGVQCPGGQSCQQQDVKCKAEPCPPVPTCKKARSLMNLCTVGQPMAVEGTNRPFLCGLDAGKPNCPPLYECLVEFGNDYGVCCPNSLKYKKPGVQPLNLTTCHKAKALSELLAVNEREGRGYIPDCNGPGGIFTPKQCSRNGLVCWCVDPKTGNKIKGSMGAAKTVNCDGVENMIARSLGRSVNMNQCDVNICAAICEYGFKNDHNGCPTCECAEPCEGFFCPMSSHCEVVSTDPLCSSGSALCASAPICKPDLAYSNPCDIGTPLSDNITGEVFYCNEDERQSREYQPRSFFDEDPKEGRAVSNQIMCPDNYKCTKLHKESTKVCCPLQEESVQVQIQEERQQSMCEYLRDFSDRMEGTEEGMQLALPAPKCTQDGFYQSRQCSIKKVMVTYTEQRKILEENAIWQMRKLLHAIKRRDTRSGENLRLYRIDEGLLNVRMESIEQARSAKLIDVGSMKQQNLDGIFETDVKKASASKRPILNDEMVEIEVEECWCVDSFGTEIPESRDNATTNKCDKLRETIECLDLSCRMGCEYGFILDPDSKCPMCHCRDPCEGIKCAEGKECRTVDVTCEGEYCPPVPACLPRKPGQCPFLVPPGSETNCEYECRSDMQCDGNKRCCSSGCGTNCVEPLMKTACQHLQTIQKHQASELGIPAIQTYITQCDEQYGKWKEIQCGLNSTCWCVETENGREISGTRIKDKTPVCKLNSAIECPLVKCDFCENGYKVSDDDGCQTCVCRNFCDEITCLKDEECQLINVDCVDTPCPKMPICVPRRESVCPEGNPLMLNEKEVLCGPQNENEACPTTHTCQINPMTHRGVCCAKTRDVCFESIDNNCLAKGSSIVNTTKWKFSPKQNKCAPVAISLDEPVCHSKNLFHNELACNSVCPVLTQCERLKLKNSLAARRTGLSSIWFQPRCDPITGHWSPIQCLGKQPPQEQLPAAMGGVSRTFSESGSQSQSENGVCWCADKKGAPLKGTLTREVEPICNHRQARRRMQLGDESVTHPLMEELIRQMALLVDDDNENSLFEEIKPNTESSFDTTTITERILEIANSITESEINHSTSNITENTFQTVVFVIATGSAFLVSILVVFIMLKRGKRKVLNNYSNNKVLGNGDKYLDYSSPIFVLSGANEKDISTKNENGAEHSKSSK